MNTRYKDVVIFGDVDWNTYWYQTQQIALTFARRGHRVIYVNRTLQRFPKYNHFAQRFLIKKKPSVSPPGNIKVISPLWLPPYGKFRRLNQILIRQTVSQLRLHQPLLITYSPTFNILDFMELAKPVFSVYVNVHNYEHNDVLPDLLVSEKILAKKAGLLMADSVFHKKRLEIISGRGDIRFSMAGVDYENFKMPLRLGFPENNLKLCYFGGVGVHIDMDIYNALAEKFEICFIGKVQPEIRRNISPRIRILEPVANQKLPLLLKKFDVLTYFCIANGFSKGVLPAKFFECMATGKPFLYSGLKELQPYEKIIYDVKGSPVKALNILRNLNKTENAVKIKKRIQLGKDADWKNRMNDFANVLETKISGHLK